MTAKGHRSNTEVEMPCFDLGAYDQCTTWKLEDWCSALSLRMRLNAAWDRYWQFGEPNMSQETMDGFPYQLMSQRELLEAAEHILRNPLIAELPRAHPSVSGICIRDQSVTDLFNGADDFKNPGYEPWAASYSEMPPYPGFFAELENAPLGAAECEQVVLEMTNGTQAWKMKTDVEGLIPHEFFIAVSLNASDDQLCSEFRSWLKEIRRNVGLKSHVANVGEANFKRWHKERLLPFIDLSFWATTRRTKFTNASIGRVLFPNHEEGKGSVDEIVRRTTTVRANELLSHVFVSALFRQLEEEKCA